MRRYQYSACVVMAAAGLVAGVIVLANVPGQVAPGSRPSPSVRRYPVAVLPGAPAPLVEVTDDRSGQPVWISCGTCHATRTPNPANKRTEDLDLFHQDLKIQHGSLTCLSCHNNQNYDTLKLANEAQVPFEEVLDLCSQCHGPQRRDYDHGAHGGMNGYWDLTRGGQTRNVCTRCHDPHVPAYGRVRPAAPPADRFLTSQRKGVHE